VLETRDRASNGRAGAIDGIAYESDVGIHVGSTRTGHDHPGR
jgi:hypothetical protein